MEEQKGTSMESPAAKEKIREFCYELALALRRITGKVVENDLAFLEGSQEEPLKPGHAQENQEDQEDQKASD